MSFVESSKRISKKVKWIDVLLTCCSFSILIYFNVASLLETNSLAVTKSSFLLTAWDMIRKAELFSSCFLFIYQIQRRKLIVQFLEKLHNFDEKVRKSWFRKFKNISIFQAKSFHIFVPHKSCRNYEICRIIVTVLAIVSMSMFIPLAYLFVKEQALNASVASVYLFVVTVRVFFGVQFIFASFAIRKRFEALNVHLMDSTSTKVLSLIAKNHFLASNYSVIYNILCDAIDLANETFTFQLIFVFGITMVRRKVIYKYLDVNLYFD